MAYIFIWSGFVYRLMDGAKINRLSQGFIEKHFGTKRREIPKPIVPARYILLSLRTALADCALVETCNRNIEDHAGGRNNDFHLINIFKLSFYYSRFNKV